MSIFTSIKVKRPKSTSFPLNHKYVGNAGFGALIPIMCQECIPGDSFKFSSEILVESFPMLASIYGDIDVKVEYFFVPNRLLWSKWEEFITGGEDGLFSSRVPIFSDVDQLGFFREQSARYCLWDYLGLPLNNTPNDNYGTCYYDENNPVTLLPFNAYRRIWNDWYRNENIQEELPLFDKDIDISNDFEFADLNTLLYRNWRKDYFTSSLPWVQRGVAPLVQVDGSVATIDGLEFSLQDGSSTQIIGNDITNVAVDLSLDSFPSGLVYFDKKEGAFCYLSGSLGSTDHKATFNRVPAIYLAAEKAQTIEEGYYFISSENSDDGFDISRARINSTSQDVDIKGLSFDINELRRTNAVQRWLERNARAGGRYIEQIASHFGIVVPDYRLQRSEFIGGLTQPVRIGQVLQTDTPVDEPTLVDALGTPAGKASSGLYTGKRRYRCLEHGWIMGIMSIVPRAEYYQGTPKKFTRTDRFDYYFPEFGHLGEEVVRKSEVYTYPWKSNNLDDTFGYQSCFSSYKWERNYVVGDFRKSLKYWVLSRDLSLNPNNPSTLGLNDEFISFGSVSNETLRNVFSVPSNERPFRFYVKNHIIAKRPMPKYGTPRL